MELGPKQKEWVAALRSGDYKQGRNRLYDEKTDCYCCLGVGGKLCELRSDQMGVLGTLMGMGIGSPKKLFRLGLGLKDSGGLFEGAPVSYTNPDTGFVNSLNTLYELNDVAHWSFDQIADFIEDRADDLFYEPV